MKKNNQSVSYAKIQVTEEALKEDVLYAFDVIDVVFSPEGNRIKVQYSASEWESNLIGYFQEEYDLTSEKFKEILKTAFYISEDVVPKEICIDDFKKCWFFGKIKYEADVPGIDWETVDPRVACDCDLS